MKLPDTHKPHLYSDIEKYQMHNEKIAAQLTVAYHAQLANPACRPQNGKDVFETYELFLSKLNTGEPT